MNQPFEELKMYQNFDELANDVLDFAKEILPEQMLYLSAIEAGEQRMLKIANDKGDIPMVEGMQLELNQSLCKLIDFETKQPVVLENIPNAEQLGDWRKGLDEAHVRSYLGIPIVLTSGETFGTLCAINNQVSLYEQKNVQLLQRIVRLFLYYLELERYAWKDALTGLYNRRYLTKQFDDHLGQAGAIFFLDLDGFKQVNDLYGHETGDIVLQEVAQRLQRVVREQDDAMAVRLGGDEFILYFGHADTKEGWEQLAAQIVSVLSEWDTDYRVSTSIGIVTYNEYRPMLQDLLQQADIALYAAKSSGKNAYQFYELVKK
ncbi:diguanylate cyclase [Exiguobacterium sp. BMC-KP]|uniref:sensor domain-containing diguanylate cyclase n=1 Tax=Exiguobacterium sp. BMC-KP TaxID=1684312 RepID=UPI0006AA50FA|nr:sensor domain-containing diguanylate cyclase [Exiguobacterium sp. BMC-KP]KOP28983.1 diguanylate cyclase [Exiguobacterium sp. BMC-KP]